MDFSYILENYINCLIEAVALMLFFGVLNDRRRRWPHYLAAFLLLSVASLIVTMVDLTNLVIMPMNFVLIIGSFLLSMTLWDDPRDWRNVFQQALFSFLALLSIQAILLCLVSTKRFGVQRGYRIINSLVCAVAFVALLLSKQFHWARYYRMSKRLAWAFIISLFLPEVILMQLFAGLMGAENSEMMVTLLLLQTMYVLLLVVFFFHYRHRAESERLAATQNNIDTMNEYLDQARRDAHDFNKHIHYLHSLVATQSTQPELREATDAYCREVLALGGQEEILLQLDDPTFRALLYRRKIQAKKHGVELRLDASTVLPVFPLKNYQLVTVFDNLMDNAFECVLTQPVEQYVRVELNTQPLANGRTLHRLVVENPYAEAAPVQRDRYTTKGGHHQGVGLSNVTQLVRDTGGQVRIAQDNGLFRVTVEYTTH